MSNVSIIIPNFNNASYLPACLESCLQQGNCIKEIIVIDDHSDDESWQILLSYQRKYSKLIKVFKNKDKGACSARNFGFELSSGDYIQWLDSDDFLGKNKLFIQLNELLLQDPYSISFAKTIHFYESSEGRSKQKVEDFDFQISNNPSSFLLHLWGGANFKVRTIQTGAWLIPRNLIKDAGHWDNNLLRDQDGEYFTRIALACNRIIYSDQANIFYRKVEKSGSITQTDSELYYRSELNAIHLKFTHLSHLREEELFKKAFANLYFLFAIKCYKKYNHLYKEAWEEYLKLGIKVPIPKLGGKVVQISCSLLGWKYTLNLKNFFKKFIN